MPPEPHSPRLPPPSPPLPTSRAFLTRLVSALPSDPPPPPPSPPARPLHRQAHHQPPPSNPLRHLRQPDRNLLLTLHVLFPHELLPALDLLDRGLVTRFRVAADASEPRAAPHGSPTRDDDGADRHRNTPNADAEEKGGGGGQHPHDTDPAHAVTPAPAVYYVLSARHPPPPYRSHRRTRSSGGGGGTSSSAPRDAPGSYEIRPAAWNCSCPAFAFAAFPAWDDGVADAVDGVGASGDEGNDADEWSFGGWSRGVDHVPVCKHLLACVLAERCGLFAGYVEEKVVGVAEAAGWAAGWGD